MIVRKCCPPGIFSQILDSISGLDRGPESASSFDQQLESVYVYASIKNMTSSQEHSKSSFVAKCLSSLHNVCKLEGSIYSGPLSAWKGPSKRWCLS